MDKTEMCFRKVFLGLGDALTFMPAEAEWGTLHEIRGKVTKEMKKLLERVELDKRNLSADETQAFARAEKIVDTINGEMDSREARGDKSPPGKFKPTAGIRTTEGIVTGREAVAGGVGLRYGELFYGRRDANLSRGDFKSFGEFLEVASSGKYDARAMTTGLSDGGAQVPDYWAREIYDATMEESVTLGRCRTYPMQSGTLHIPAWDSHDKTKGPLGSFAAAWFEEDAPASEVSPKMRLITLTAQKLGIYISASREVLEDGLSLESQIGPALRQSLGFAMDDAIINGTGVARPMGIRNASSTISVNRAGANAIAYTDVMNMYTRLLPSMVAGSQWIVSPDALRQLLAMVDGASHYVWVPNTSGVAQGVPGYLLGAPVYISEKAAKLGTKGDLILCNLGAYALGVRKEIILEKSNSVFWSRDLMSFRVLVRFTGEPLLQHAITPANGSANTLSWAVQLDTP